jgi:hypothetical protein
VPQDISSNLDTAVRVLDIAIAIGRYILPITVAFSLLSAAAAVNGVATGNIAGTIFWSFLSSLGIIFASQIVLKRKRRKIGRSRRIMPKFPQAAEA